MKIIKIISSLLVISAMTFIGAGVLKIKRIKR